MLVGRSSLTKYTTTVIRGYFSKYQCELPTPLSVRLGIIDSDYRGPLAVFIENPNNVDVYITPDKGVAQLIITPYLIAEPTYCNFDQLSKTQRGIKGFGSTDQKPPPPPEPSF